MPKFPENFEIQGHCRAVGAYGKCRGAEAACVFSVEREGEDIRLSRAASARGAGAAVTTLKDLVKINQERLPGPSALPLWALETGCEITANEMMFQQQLNGLLPQMASVRRAA